MTVGFGHLTARQEKVATRRLEKAEKLIEKGRVDRAEHKTAQAFKSMGADNIDSFEISNKSVQIKDATFIPEDSKVTKELNELATKYKNYTEQNGVPAGPKFLNKIKTAFATPEKMDSGFRMEDAA